MSDQEAAMVDKGERVVTWQELGMLVAIFMFLAVPFCLGRYVFPKHDTVICTYSYSTE